MPVHRVVVLVNLALAVGALAGYLWRQGEVAALRSAAERARVGRLEQARPPRQWSVSGIGVAGAGERIRFTVVERDRDLVVVTVEREQAAGPGSAGPR